MSGQSKGQRGHRGLLGQPDQQGRKGRKARRDQPGHRGQLAPPEIPAQLAIPDLPEPLPQSQLAPPLRVRPEAMQRLLTAALQQRRSSISPFLKALPEPKGPLALKVPQAPPARKGHKVWLAPPGQPGRMALRPGHWLALRGSPSRLTAAVLR